MTRIDTAHLYFKEIRNLPVFSQEELKDLWKRLKKGDRRAKKKLVESNLKLVVPVTRKYLRRGVDFLDLVEEGNIGLMRAVEKFKPSKKISFSTYANYWIDQAIRRALEDKSRIIRIPAHMWDNIHSFLKKRDKLINEEGREPSINELSKSMRLSKKQVKDIQNATSVARSVKSLDAPIDVEGEILVRDVIPDGKSPTPESVTEIIRQTSGVDEALKNLDLRARKIVELRFGLGGMQPESLGVIADQMKISRERVRQIEEISLKRLKYIFLKLGILDKDQAETLKLDSRGNVDRRQAADRRHGAPDMRRRRVERRRGERRSGRDRRMH